MSQDKVTGDHSQVHNAPKTQHKSKKDFDHEAANSTDEAPAGSSSSSGTSPGTAFLRKMLPGISDKDAKAFLKTLYNNLANEFKKAADRSKKTLQKLREDDEGR